MRKSTEDGVAVGMGDDVVDKTAVELACLTRQKAKQSMARACLLVDQAATLLAALGKTDCAAALRLVWALNKTRLAFAYHSMQANGYKFRSDMPAPESLLESWKFLASDLCGLQAYRQSAGIAESFANSEYLFTTMCLPEATFAQFDKEIEYFRTVSKELIQSTCSKLAAGLQLEAGSLENAVPDYAPYVVDKFVTEEIQEKLINIPWGPFAKNWSALMKQCQFAKNFDHMMFDGKFEVRFPEAMKLTARALATGRTFVAIVSTVKAILVTLPAAPKDSG